MATLVDINTTCNFAATGKIAESIGLIAKRRGWEVYHAHGPRYINPTSLEHYQIGTLTDERIHAALWSRILDSHGLGTKAATRKFVTWLEHLKPDVVHLHNLHGYYINFPILFEYLKNSQCRVIWTMHDCWAITGHCTNFEQCGCEKWRQGCNHCPQRSVYPKSLFLDRSEHNYNLKKKWFTCLGERLTIVPVSEWTASNYRQSFFSKTHIEVIRNGINLNVFKPTKAIDFKEKYGITSKWVILGVANGFSPSKGIYDFYKLREMLPEDISIMLVGVKDEQKTNIPKGVIAISRTQNATELAEIYSSCDLFVNPTYEDNYPTVNLEAMACGTPVVTYDTGGCKEAVNEKVGRIVKQGDVKALESVIKEILYNSATDIRDTCRHHAESIGDQQKCFERYIALYSQNEEKKANKTATRNL